MHYQSRIFIEMSLKVKVNLVGGLGNQLFGLFFAFVLKSFVNGEVFVSGALIPYGSNRSRRIEVHKLNLVSLNQIQIQLGNEICRTFITRSSFLRRVFWRLNLIRVGRSRINLENFWKGNTIFSNRIEFLDYFADWFFPEFAKERGIIELKKESSQISHLSDKTKSLLESKREACFVHVRLGDYLSFPDIYEILSDQFYEAALKLLSERIGNNDFEVIVIAEDSEELRNRLPKLFSRADEIVTRHSGIEDLESFEIMCQSKYLIAANSTFSLWAAWFGLRNRHVTIVPCGDKVKGAQDGLLALDWTVLDTVSGEVIPRVDRDKWMSEKSSRLTSSLNSLFSKDALL